MISSGSGSGENGKIHGKGMNAAWQSCECKVEMKL